MGGYKDHRNALKPQNMTYEERVNNMKVKGKQQCNQLKKVIQPGDTSIMDNYYIFEHGMNIDKKLGRPLSYSSPQELSRQIGEYIQYCSDKDLVPINSGLALWLGIDHGTMVDWRDNPANPFSPILKKASELFHSFAQQKTLDGQINPILYMFLSKNYWGMSDKTEIVHRSSTSGIDLDEQQRIINSTPGIVIDAQIIESEPRSEDLCTNTLPEDLGSQKAENLASEDLAAENLEDEDLDDMLLGGSEDLGEAEDLGTYTQAEDLDNPVPENLADQAAEDLGTWDDDL